MPGVLGMRRDPELTVFLTERFDEIGRRFEDVYRRLGSLHALDATLALVERATGLQIRVHRGKITTTETQNWTPYERSWKQLSDLVQHLSELRDLISATFEEYAYARADGRAAG